MTNMAKGAMCQKLLRWKCPICHIWRNNLVTLDNPIKVKLERINHLFGKNHRTHIHVIVKRLLVAKRKTENWNISRTIMLRYLTLPKWVGISNEPKLHVQIGLTRAMSNHKRLGITRKAIPEKVIRYNISSNCPINR